MYPDEKYVSRSKGRWWTGLVAVFFVILLVGGLLLAQNYKHLGNLLKVISLIHSDYLFEADTTVLVDGAIQGLVESLDDPYSTYLDADTFSQMQEMIRGSFGGLGILVGLKDDSLTVFRTYDNTPAQEQGIVVGDVITKVGDQDVQGVDLNTVVDMMRGPVGSKISLTIQRQGEAAPMVVSLTRKEISIPTVEGKMVDNQVAYIVISQFTEKTPAELKHVLKDLQQHVVKGILLDLRDNPGGELQSVIKVAGNFIPNGPVVYIQPRNGPTEMLSTTGNDLGLPLVVLVNEGSASAAEILAGAIQDTKSGVLVGEKTFGKGIVQTVFALNNGAGVKLTTARYLTPSKHDINQKGIEPDETVVLEKNSSNGDSQFLRGLEILHKQIEDKAA